MINNQDAGDISGLEEVFRSQEFGRTSGTTAVGPAGADLSLRRGDGILGTRFGRRPVAAPVGRTEDDAGSRRTPDAVGSPGAGADEDPASKEPSSVPSSGAGAGPGKGPAGGPFVWRRHSSRYWTIASVSALSALVAAGITAGMGQHPRSHVAAQARHGGSRPGGGLNTSGAASTGLAAPGGLLADAGGSAGPSSVAGTNSEPRSGNAPGGHVTLIGAATFTGAPGSQAAPSGGAPSGAGGAGGAAGSAACGHQSGRSRRVHRREHGELRDVVHHDARERDRGLRLSCGLDHRCCEQCHHHDRSGRERDGRVTTANCRWVASRLRQRTSSRTVSALTRSS